MSQDKIVNLHGEAIKVTTPQEPQSWIISIIGAGDKKDDVFHLTGYFKFGAQFVAMLDGESEDSNLLFATPTHLLRSAVVEKEIEVDVA